MLIIPAPCARARHFQFLYILVFRMIDGIVIDSIINYCDDRKFIESSKELGSFEENSEFELHEIFEKYFQKISKNENKLSFTFNVDNKRSLLKERLSKMNDVKPKLKMNRDKSTKSKKLKVEEKENDIPEAFLLLMDDLCLDRKNAKKFFESSNEWSYVKSDRKIFCAKKGM